MLENTMKIEREIKMDESRKLLAMLINRGCEIDNPSDDPLYLKIERAYILSVVLLNLKDKKVKEIDDMSTVLEISAEKNKLVSEIL